MRKKIKSFDEKKRVKWKPKSTSSLFGLPFEELYNIYFPSDSSVSLSISPELLGFFFILYVYDDNWQKRLIGIIIKLITSPLTSS